MPVASDAAASGNSLLFSNVQQIYIVLEGRELLNHEAISDSRTGETSMPTES